MGDMHSYDSKLCLELIGCLKSLLKLKLEIFIS